MAAAIYYIKCLTNLHAGNGDVNYNIIDNEVERDPATGYPTIHASGVKGALRQFFEENCPEQTVTLFGSPVRKSKGAEGTPGSLKILSAQMLGRPARASQGNSAYYMVTTKKALAQLHLLSTALKCPSPYDVVKLSDNISYRTSEGPVGVEGYTISDILPPDTDTMKEALSTRLGIGTVILTDEIFRKLPLPVLARNYLENGESKNLWYEEVVPHESVLWFAVLGSREHLEAFETAVHGKVVQFGGNASIGYGLCLVEKGASYDV